MTVSVFIHARDRDGPNAGLVEVSGVRVTATTVAAQRIQVGTYPDQRSVWLPRSQIRLEPERGGTYTVLMPRWLAKEKRFV